jgi:acetylornithine deacetylase/succinyl-diaminopimelate desuccinylase-like protein
VSGSADATHRRALDTAAEVLCAELVGLGFTGCRVIRLGGQAPSSVWGEAIEQPGRPTVLLYGHFDVQPIGDPAGWASSPFGAGLAAGRVHGRGASDNKGPLVAALIGLAQLRATAGRFPVNVRVWFEGEEEVGSPHLPQFLARHGELLRADALAFSDDVRLAGPGIPTVVVGLRGMLEVCVTTTRRGRPLHSGTYGGEVADPALELGRMLATLRTSDGRIGVPGFYAQVRPVDVRTRRNLAAGRPSRAGFAAAAELTASELSGESGWQPGERSTLRPSLTVVSLAAGGPKAAAAIPTRASARLNLRLVPEQVPDVIAGELLRHLRAVTPKGISVTVRVGAGAEAVAVPLGHPIVRALHHAVADTWGRWPVQVRSGGTVPIVSALQRRYRMPAAMWGLSGPADGVHGPNESFALTDLERGAQVVSRLLTEVASR